MGVSTDAILFYGFCWSEEDASLFGEDSGDREWPEIILLRRGMADPWADYPKELDALPYAESRAAGDAWCEANRGRLDAWDAAKKSVEKEFGVSVGSHCSGECPMPYLAAAASVLSASRGHPEKVKPLKVEPDWDEKLVRFLREFNIKRPHKRPRWWLVSDWR